MKKAYEIVAEHKDIPMPWKVYRVLPGGVKYLDIMGKQVSIGEDFVSVDEMREALDWLADQMGGTIKWRKK